MTEEDHAKRVKFAKNMQRHYRPDVWTQEIPFYLDGTALHINEIQWIKLEHHKDASGERRMRDLQIIASQKVARRVQEAN